MGALVRIGKSERRHHYMRKVYEKLCQDLSAIRKDQKLSMTFRALNDTPDSDVGICATNLVYGIYQKLPGSGPSVNMVQRANAIRACTEMVTRLKAQRSVRETQRIRHVASQPEVEQVRTMQPRRTVFVYREAEGCQQYELVRNIGNEVHVVLPSGRILPFSIKVVRPYHDQVTKLNEDQKQKEDDHALVKEEKDTADRIQHRRITRLQKREGRMGIVLVVYDTETHSDLCKESCEAQITALLEMGCFEIGKETEANGYRLYGLRYADLVKANMTIRSRLSVAACNDREQGLSTTAQTIRRISLRLLLTVAVSCKIGLYLRDVTRAFVKSKTLLRCVVYMNAPKEMNIQKGKVLKVLRPLYGMPEVPIHCFKTDSDYHKAYCR